MQPYYTSGAEHEDMQCATDRLCTPGHTFALPMPLQSMAIFPTHHAITVHVPVDDQRRRYDPPVHRQFAMHGKQGVHEFCS
jgi:hypothetical protein